MKSRRSVAIFLGALALITVLALPVWANVTLVSFTADTLLGQAPVFLEWETATELNTTGFNLKRAQTLTGSSVIINTNLIPAQGDGITGWVYDYLDENVTLNANYYYWLEVINNDQSTQEFGPVGITAGVGPITLTQPTSTATNTATPSATPSRTPTATRTPTRTATPAPGEPTATVAPSATPTFVVISGATVTPASRPPTQAANATPTATGTRVVATATSRATVNVTATPAAFDPAPTRDPFTGSSPLATPSSVAIRPTIDSGPPPTPRETQIAMAPVIIATPVESAPPAPSGGNPVVIVLIGGALLLLGGGLYAIIRLTGKPA